MIVDGVVESMELGHLPYKKDTFEYYVGQRGLDRLGKHKWQGRVADVVAHFVAALEPDDVVLGGGNVKYLKTLPPKCRAGDNANAFLGGFRLWENDQKQKELKYGNSSGTNHESTAHGTAGRERDRGPSSKRAHTAFAGSAHK